MGATMRGKTKRKNWRAAFEAEHVTRKGLVDLVNETLFERDQGITKNLQITGDLNAERLKLQRARRALAAAAEYLETLGKTAAASAIRGDIAELV
jgi:hypothetical protein